jgi:recombination protein RecA
MESGLDLMEVWIQYNVDVIIVDSVPAMVPRSSLEGSISADEQIGVRARKLSQTISKMVGQLKNSKSAVIFLNQERAAIKKSKYDQGPDVITSGGKALKYYSSLRLKMEPKKVEWKAITDPITGRKDAKKTIGIYTKVTAIKNKLDSHQGDSGEVFIRYGKGIDNVRTILDIAVERRVISKGGAWFQYDCDQDEKLSFKVQGKEGIQAAFKSNPLVFDAVKNDVLKLIHSKQETDMDEMGEIEELDGSVDTASEVVMEETEFDTEA